MSTTIAAAVCLLSIVATSWGHAGQSKPGGAVSQRTYRLATLIGPMVAVIAGALAVALRAAGAP